MKCLRRAGERSEPQRRRRFVITQETWMDIKGMSRQGMSVRRIARTTGLSRVTVRRALMQTVPKKYGPRPKKAGKLTPYEDYLVAQMAARAWAKATTLYEEVRRQGYSGHYEGVKRFVRGRRREERARRAACVRFETLPGVEAQADWKGPVRGLLAAEPARELHLFRLVLGYSRRRVTFVAFRLKLAEILWDLRRAFEQLGGVPRRLVTDNLKAAVLVPRPSLRLHPFFSSFCDHYGVQPDPALPYSPERKGKVERSFGAFVDDEILHRSYPDVAGLQAALDTDDRLYGERLCATTGEAPLDRFEKERGELLPLPQIAFDPRTPEPRRVFSDCTVSFGGARYSVPFLHVGRVVTVKEDPKDGKLELFYEDRLVASHQKARKGQRIVVEEHVKELLRPRWDRLPKRKIPTPDSGRPRIPNVSPLVPWPDLSVETRAVSIYQALAEGGRS